MNWALNYLKVLMEFGVSLLNQILAKPGDKLGYVKRHEIKNMKASFVGQDVMAAKMFEG